MKEFMHPVRRDKAPADLNHAIANTLTVARSEYKYVARVETDLQRDLPHVICHIGDLNQVFLNLIVNAAQAIAEVVATHPAAPWASSASAPAARTTHVVIEVSDTGRGHPARGAGPWCSSRSSPPRRPGKGTGQGLAIARTIVVDRHGGDITFDVRGRPGHHLPGAPAPGATYPVSAAPTPEHEAPCEGPQPFADQLRPAARPTARGRGGPDAWPARLAPLAGLARWRRKMRRRRFDAGMTLDRADGRRW